LGTASSRSQSTSGCAAGALTDTVVSIATSTAPTCEAGERHTSALRNLFNKLLGCLYHCLQTRTLYDSQRAFGPSLALAA
jgi:hypothetical protein